MFMDNKSEKKGRSLKSIDDLRNILEQLNIAPKSDDKLEIMLAIFNESNDKMLFDSTISGSVESNNILNLEDKLDLLRIKFSITSIHPSTTNTSNLSNNKENEKHSDIIEKKELKTETQLPNKISLIIDKKSLENSNFNENLENDSLEKI